MPKVPEWNLEPLKPKYSVSDPDKPATLKQKNYITILCERRKITVPYMKHMKMGEAARLISEMTNN